MRGLCLLFVTLPHPRLAQDHRGSPAAIRAPLVRVAVFAPRVQRFLALQFHHYSGEFGACLVGRQHGDTLVVLRADPADLDPTDVTPTTVNWWRPCHESTPGAVGMIHSHPNGAACYFKLPELPIGRTRLQFGGDSLWTQDAVYFFQRPAFSIVAIMCGDRIAWMSRDSVTRFTTLPESLQASRLSRRKPASARCP